MKKRVREEREGGQRDQCVHIEVLSICVRAYACLQLCVDVCVCVFFHMRRKMSGEIVNVERRRKGRQRALSGGEQREGKIEGRLGSGTIAGLYL